MPVTVTANVPEEVAALQRSKYEPSVATLKKIFGSLRKTNVVCSKLVAKHGWKVICATGDLEKWTIVEQVAVAALTTGDLDLAQRCIELLVVQFPKSFRVKRLLGMQHEAMGEFAAALELYDAILAEQPADNATLKRKAALCRSRGDRAGAVTALNTVLAGASGAMGDASAWIELAELYLENAEHAEAAYCLEELVLLDPHNCHHHCRLADAYYSQGGVSCLLKARRHYTMSLNFQAADRNVRALLGLLYTCQALTAEGSSVSSSGKAAGSSSSSSSGVSSDAATAAAMEPAEANSGLDESAVTAALLQWAVGEVAKARAPSGSAMDVLLGMTKSVV